MKCAMCSVEISGKTYDSGEMVLCSSCYDHVMRANSFNALKYKNPPYVMNVGWICPVCLTIYGPHISSCDCIKNT